MGNTGKVLSSGSKLRTVLIMALLGAFFLALSPNTESAFGENLQHYKMISTVEYKGHGQFRNQVETLFSVKREALPEGVMGYYIESDGLDQLSFKVDRRAQRLSAGTEGLEYFATVANDCARLMTKVTRANIGKTWKHTVDLSSVDKSLPTQMNFTLTAIEVENAKYGELVAVRALSEPFFVKTSDGSVISRINAVYLFDSQIEDIYLSLSVYQSSARFNGTAETLRHEVATYKTNSEGNAVELGSLGNKFGQFVNYLGLSRSGLEVSQKASLPQWAESEGIRAAQVANICASTACEGALNPVSMVSIPAAKVIEFQKESDVIVAGNTNLEAAGKPGIWQQLVNKYGFWPASAIVGGVTVGTVAVAGGFSGGGSSHASP